MPETTPESHDSQRWIEINSDALASNVKVLKAAFKKRDHTPQFMAVVKANAYGHDAALIAPILRDAGVDAFGVTTLDEAISLMSAGIDPVATPILCFAPINDPDALDHAITHDLHITITDSNQLYLAQTAETRTGLTANLHLKVDTGMGRLGLKPEDAIKVLKSRPKWAGVYTHFANSSMRSKSATRKALGLFKSFLYDASQAGIDVGIRHCANSAAALRFPESSYDMVRIGTALYGQMPSNFVPKPKGLRSDTFDLKARILQVRTLESGDSVGYGSQYVAPTTVRDAVIPIGFGDGFGVAPVSLFQGFRGLQALIKPAPLNVIINGARAQVLGRVAMQMIVVDVSNIPGQIHSMTLASVPIRRLSASSLIPRVLVRDK